MEDNTNESGRPPVSRKAYQQIFSQAIATLDAEDAEREKTRPRDGEKRPWQVHTPAVILVLAVLTNIVAYFYLVNSEPDVLARAAADQELSARLGPDNDLFQSANEFVQGYKEYKSADSPKFRDALDKFLNRNDSFRAMSCQAAPAGQSGIVMNCAERGKGS